MQELDLGLNGNHEITCPYCQHIHYRVVENGVVTEDRYRSSAGQIFVASTSTTINVSVSFTTSSTMTQSWLSTTSSTW